MAKTPTKPVAPKPPIEHVPSELSEHHHRLLDLFEELHGPQALSFFLQCRVLELTMLSGCDEASAAQLVAEYNDRLVSTRRELG